VTNVAEKSLYEVFAELPDPRNPSGRRHPLAAMLTLAASAMLCGCRSVYAIAQWGRDHPELAKPMGFMRKKRVLPCGATFHYLFKDLDVSAFESALKKWMMTQGANDLDQLMLNIDGKTLRGTQGDLVAGVHLLAAYSQHLGTALTQLAVDSKTNEHKAALELLKLVPVKGTLFTGDAIFAQRDLSQEIVSEGGDYFFTVKDNQPTLKQNILDAFDAPVSPSGKGGTGGKRLHRSEPGQTWGSRRTAENRNAVEVATVS
jgi:hypothetical protein